MDSLDQWLNRVTEGDAIEAMARLPDECIDLALCDPPYAITDCAWDREIPFESMWRELTPESRATVRRVGWIDEFEAQDTEVRDEV